MNRRLTSRAALTALAMTAFADAAKAADPVPAEVPGAVRESQPPASPSPPPPGERNGAAPAQELTVRGLLRQYVLGTLRQNPQLLQSEADSRAAEYRIGEARGNLLPRLSVTATAASERQQREDLPGVNFDQRSGQVRMVVPVYDGVAKAQVAQRQSASTSADWRLTDVREQLILRTIESYVELVRAARLVQLAQDNLRTHRSYVAQIKEIARMDLGRAADVSAAVARTSLAESVLLSRVARLDSTKSQWRQLTGMSAPPLLPAPPQVELPKTLDSVLAVALNEFPAIQLARAEVEVARDGIAVAKAPYQPRVNLEANTRFGADWGGYVGNQTTRYMGVSVDIPVFNGFSGRYASQAATEQLRAATHAQDRVRDELRRRVEQFWFDLQSAAASLRAYEDYAKSARDLVDATRNQFKIGRRTLLDVLNAENELFTARSNVESTRLDILQAGWRLISVRGRIAQELEL